MCDMCTKAVENTLKVTESNEKFLESAIKLQNERFTKTQ